MKDGEPLLDRREFLIGAASLFTASISLILQAQEALARNSHKDIERLLSSGKYDEAIKKQKHIRWLAGVEITRIEKSRTATLKAIETITKGPEV